MNNPAQLHEPALPSNRGWIGHWCYISPPWLFSCIYSPLKCNQPRAKPAGWKLPGKPQSFISFREIASFVVSFYFTCFLITLQCRGFTNEQAWFCAGRIVHKSLELCHSCREKGLCSRNASGILLRPLPQKAHGEGRKTISPIAGLGGTLRTQLLRLFYRFSTQRATILLPFFLISTSWNSDQTPDNWSPCTFVSPGFTQPGQRFAEPMKLCLTGQRARDTGTEHHLCFLGPLLQLIGWGREEGAQTLQ